MGVSPSALLASSWHRNFGDGGSGRSSSYVSGSARRFLVLELLVRFWGYPALGFLVLAALEPKSRQGLNTNR